MTIAQFKNLIVDSSEGIEDVRDGENIYRYLVTLTIEGNGTGMAFPHYGSVADFKQGLRVLDEHDTLYAAMYVLQSGYYGSMEYREFADDVYNEWSKDSYDTWENCRAIYNSLSLMGVDMHTNKWIDLMNEIREAVDG